MDFHLPSPSNLLHKGVNAVNDGVEALKDGMSAAGKLPGKAVDGLKAGADAILPDALDMHPKLPPYSEIPAVERAKALQRSHGLTYEQRAIRDKNGNPHEPVSMTMSGTKEEVVAALQKAGWHKADQLDAMAGIRTIGTMLNRLPGVRKVFDYNYESSPVSDMYLNGKRYEMAFNKNNHHDFARDHLRIFETDKKDADGRPIWEVATTRDVGMHIDVNERKGSHHIDPEIDHERDMVMADLLHAGTVKDWHIAKGEMPVAAERQNVASEYTTDGNVLLVDLKANPAANKKGISPQDKVLHEVVDHLPGPLQDAAHSANETLTQFFKGFN